MKSTFLKLANNLRFIALLYIGTLLTASVLFMLIEGVSFWNSFWWATVTSLTIGYGDIVPATLAGKILTIITGHICIMAIAPLIIANLASKVLMSRHEFTHNEQEWMMDSIAKIAKHNKVELDPEPTDTSKGSIGSSKGEES